MNPKVSIVVPVYKVENYLHSCINSLLNQTYENIEIILVEDGSPDKCPAICDAFSKEDTRIKVIHKENGGLSDARNAGVAEASGLYTMFLDSDDYFDENTIEVMVAAALKNESSVVICGYYIDFIDEKERLVSSKKEKPLAGSYKRDQFNEIPLDIEMIGYIGYAWNKLYKTILIKGNGCSFEKGLSLIEDIVFNSDVLSNTDSITFMDQTLIHYMQRNRETLGAKFYEDYFTLKLRGIQAVVSLMGNWGRSYKETKTIEAQLVFLSLKSTLLMLSCATNFSKQKKQKQFKLILVNQFVQSRLSIYKPENYKDKAIKHLMRTKKSHILILLYSLKK